MCITIHCFPRNTIVLLSYDSFSGMLKTDTKLYRTSYHVHISPALFALKHEDCSLFCLFNVVLSDVICAHIMSFHCNFNISCVAFLPTPLFNTITYRVFKINKNKNSLVPPHRMFENTPFSHKRVYTVD